jgi:putative ABC transport system substrate-binding protein
MLVLGLAMIGSQAQARTYTVSVNQFVEHTALNATLQGMQDYLKDNNVDVKFKVHIAQGNTGIANQIAQQMIGEEPDLMVAIATPCAQACAQALNKAPEKMKRPLVFTAVTDPVAAGLVEDLIKPGGNTTGVSDQLQVKKHLEMIIKFKPGIKRLGVMYNAGEANSKATITEIKAQCEELGIKVVESTAANTAEVYQAAKGLAGRVDAIFIPTDNTIVKALESVLKIGTQAKVPVFAADVDAVKRGAVAAMGFDYYKLGIKAGAMVEKILKGTSPADLPVGFLDELQLHINVKASEMMGITPPQELLEQASQIYN